MCFPSWSHSCLWSAPSSAVQHHKTRLWSHTASPGKVQNLKSQYSGYRIRISFVPLQSRKIINGILLSQGTSLHLWSISTHPGENWIIQWGPYVGEQALEWESKHVPKINSREEDPDAVAPLMLPASHITVLGSTSNSSFPRTHTYHRVEQIMTSMLGSLFLIWETWLSSWLQVSSDPVLSSVSIWAVNQWIVDKIALSLSPSPSLSLKENEN